MAQYPKFIEYRCQLTDSSNAGTVDYNFIRTFCEHAMAQLIETLRYERESRLFDSRWRHRIFH